MSVYIIYNLGHMKLDGEVDVVTSGLLHCIQSGNLHVLEDFRANHFFPCASFIGYYATIPHDTAWLNKTYEC